MVHFLKKKNWLFLLICFLNFIGMSQLICSDRQSGKIIHIHSLHLYEMLHDFRDILVQQTPTEEDQEGFSIQLELVEDAIRKMSDIVDVFNSDTFYTQENQYKNLDIQYKFINVCNFLKDAEKVEPRHLRKLREKIKKFDHYLKSYCLREKDFLTQAEIDVFNKITQLNQILLEHLLKNKYLKLDFADKFVDCTFHRPLEVIREHPWITLALVATLGFLIVNFYYVPYVHLKNLNKNVEVTQFKVRNQWWRRNCGLHSAYNMMCFMHGQNDDQIRALLADGNAFDVTQQTCIRINGTDDDLHGDQVMQLFDAYNNIPVAARANMAIIESRPGAATDILGNLSNMPQETLVAAAAAVPGMANLPYAPQRFNAGETQYFLVNDGGHWNPFAFKRDPSAHGGVRVLTAESYWNSNITNLPVINRISQFLTGNRVLVPAH